MSSTVFTSVRSDSTMHADMDFQMAVSSKCLPTVTTHVQLDSTMYAPMSFQVPLEPKHLPTVITPVCTVSLQYVSSMKTFKMTFFFSKYFPQPSICTVRLHNVCADAFPGSLGT